MPALARPSETLSDGYRKEKFCARHSVQEIFARRPKLRRPVYLDGEQLPAPGRVLIDPPGVTWRVRAWRVDRDLTGLILGATATIEVNGGSSYRRDVTAEQVAGWEILP